MMDVQHDACRFLAILLEEPFHDMHDEFHRCVVVVEQQNAIQVRPLGYRTRFGDDQTACVVPVPALRSFRHSCSIACLQRTFWCEHMRSAVFARLSASFEARAGCARSASPALIFQVRAGPNCQTRQGTVSSASAFL